MLEPTDDGTGDARTERTTDGDLPGITCTLSEEEDRRRRAWMAENLLEHLEAIEERADGFSLVFDRNPDAYAAVTELAWKEAQCCSWATFEVELPPGDGPIRWNERSEREAGSELFAEALREIRGEFDGVPAPE